MKKVITSILLTGFISSGTAAYDYSNLNYMVYSKKQENQSTLIPYFSIKGGAVYSSQNVKTEAVNVRVFTDCNDQNPGDEWCNIRVGENSYKMSGNSFVGRAAIGLIFGDNMRGELEYSSPTKLSKTVGDIKVSAQQSTILGHILYEFREKQSKFIPYVGMNAGVSMAKATIDAPGSTQLYGIGGEIHTISNRRSESETPLAGGITMGIRVPLSDTFGLDFGGNYTYITGDYGGNLFGGSVGLMVMF